MDFFMMFVMASALAVCSLVALASVYVIERWGVSPLWVVLSYFIVGILLVGVLAK